MLVKMILKIFLIHVFLFSLLHGEENFGELIFYDDFERSESQENKDELGNKWTTSSEKTAYGEKQVDLREGHMYIDTHKKAWHATSVRHAFEFKNGTLALKLKFDDQQDQIHLNFTDMGEKSVHAGHLFNVTLRPSGVSFSDLKTGVQNLKIKKARKEKNLTAQQKKDLASKHKSVAHPLSLGKWHQIYVTIRGDKVTCSIAGKPIASFRSPGIAHETKTLIRFLVAHKVHVDDVKVWRFD